MYKRQLLARGLKVLILRSFVTFVYVITFSLLFQVVQQPFSSNVGGGGIQASEGGDSLGGNDSTSSATTSSKIRIEALRKRTLHILLNAGENSSNTTEQKLLVVQLEKIFHKISLLQNNDGLSTVGDADDEHWDLMKSIYFTVTIVTTIGYGDVTPQTTAGKWLTIICALFGIPITLLTIKSFGDIIHDLVQAIIKFSERRFFTKVDTRVANLENKTFAVTFLLMWALILAGAKMEQTHNDITLLDGIYAWFVTMTTIGFGDYVVSKRYIQGSHGDRKVYHSFGKSFGVFFFLVFGLGVVASVINAVTQVFEKNQYVKRALSTCFGVGRYAERTRSVSRTLGLRESIIYLHQQRLSRKSSKNSSTCNSINNRSRANTHDLV